ncbi:MAG TPA: creatininase family protein [Rhodothermales bacterium]|nr:creatininase family protein [Rhodothermales bacterium]
MYWDQLTSPQIDRIDRRIPVILPMAATEQHGPHLPLATDRLIGEYFCRELNERMPESILILPSMSVGCSDHHLDFAGSLSLRHDTFLRHAEDVLKSVIAHRFTRIVLLNSHGGNQGIGQVAFESLGYQNPQVKVMFATWWKVAAEELLHLNESGPGGIGHAGEFETSLIMLIAPGLVDTKAMQPPANLASFSWAEADLIRGASASVYRRMRQMTSNGAFGDPSAASAEKGRAITELVVEALAAMLTDFRNG